MFSIYNCFEYKNEWSWQQNAKFEWFSDYDCLDIKISWVESKIPNHDKHTTTPEFDKLAAENFTTRLKQTNLLNKTDFDKK